MKAFEQRIISWLWLLNLDRITDLVDSLSFKSILSGDIQATETTGWTMCGVWSKLIELCFISVGDTHICYHVKLACQKAFCPGIFKQQRRQDERYVESRQNWRSFVSSFAPPPSLPWQWSKIKKLPFDNNQKSNLTQIKNPSLKLYSKIHLCSLYPRFCRPRSS